jgi:hypothetical protein
MYHYPFHHIRYFGGMKAAVLILCTILLWITACDNRTPIEREIDRVMQQLEDGTYEKPSTPTYYTPAASEHCSNWADVSSAAEHYVTERLAAPATAKFSNWPDDWKVTTSGRDVTCRSFVDSQNAFGAMLRANFTMKLNCTDNGFTLVSVEFN